MGRRGSGQPDRGCLAGGRARALRRRYRAVRRRPRLHPARLRPHPPGDSGRAGGQGRRLPQALRHRLLPHLPAGHRADGGDGAQGVPSLDLLEPDLPARRRERTERGRARLLRRRARRTAAARYRAGRLTLPLRPAARAGHRVRRLEEPPGAGVLRALRGDRAGALRAEGDLLDRLQPDQLRDDGSVRHSGPGDRGRGGHQRRQVAGHPPPARRQRPRRTPGPALQPPGTDGFDDRRPDRLPQGRHPRRGLHRPGARAVARCASPM